MTTCHASFPSSSAAFDHKPSALQFLHEQIPMISLYFNVPLFEGASGSALLLELPGQFFQLGFRQQDSPDDGHPLTLSAFGFPTDANDAVSGGNRVFCPGAAGSFPGLAA